MGDAAAPSRRYALAAWGAVLGLGAAVWLAAAWHAGTPAVEPRWRFLAVFLPTILSLMLSPIPGGASVLLAVIAIVVVGAVPLEKALSGYADVYVWLVLAAFLLSRAFIKTGLARRIALHFVRLLGGTTLGLGYSLVASDTLLAAVIPSNGARVGGVMLPVTRSLAELYKSTPGPTARLLGAFLMLTLYQADVMACALFLTGQAGNAVAAGLAPAASNGAVTMSYTGWFLNAVLPAAACLLVIPRLVFLWERPGITRTPDARTFARSELAAMGPPSGGECVLVGVFAFVCSLWVLLPPPMAPLAALMGTGVLLLAGVLTWEDVVTERAAWDVFIWYGGLVMLGKQLDQFGLTTLFAQTVAARFDGWPWMPLFLALTLVYFYAHYAFASITTHLTSMYPAFVGVLVAAGAPPAMVVWGLAFVANFSAGLTHYGTTHGPIVFGVGYVPAGTWWRVGFRLSVVNLLVWLTLGLAWWKVRGLW